MFKGIVRVDIITGTKLSTPYSGASEVIQTSVNVKNNVVV